MPLVSVHVDTHHRDYFKAGLGSSRILCPTCAQTHSDWRLRPNQYLFLYAYVQNRQAIHRPHHWCTGCHAWCKGQQWLAAPLWYTPTHIKRKGTANYSTCEKTGTPSLCKQRGSLTLPMGLCGVFKIMALVLELNLLSSSWGLTVQSELDHFVPSVGF